MVNHMCDYRTCTKEATTKGFVMARNKDSSGSPVVVWACEKHKKVNSFFEEK